MGRRQGTVCEQTALCLEWLFMKAASAQLSQAAFEAAWAEGRAMTLEEAMVQVMPSTEAIDDP